MKPNRWLALGAALTGCSIAYAIHLLGKPHSQPPDAAIPTGSRQLPNENRRSAFKPLAAASPTANRALSESRAESLSENRTKTPESKTPVHLGKVHRAPNGQSSRMLSEEQWRENAAKVEMEANHELKRLTALLDLDPMQQEQMFASLAQRSGYWLPGMQTNTGRRSTSPDSDDLQASSNPETTPRAAKPGAQASDQRQDPGSQASDNQGLTAASSIAPDPDTGGVVLPPGSDVATSPAANGTTTPTPSVWDPANTAITTPSFAQPPKDVPSSEPAITAANDPVQNSPAPTVSDLDVSDILNSDQEQTLVQEEMDRLAWWEEVLPQLLPPQIPATDTPASDGTSTNVQDQAPETKAFEGGDLLLDE